MPRLDSNLELRVARNLVVFLRFALGVSRHVPKPRKRPGKPKGTENQRRVAGLRRKLRQAEARVAALDPELRHKNLREIYGRVRTDKLTLIDRAFRGYGCRSFADLGGIGAVDGGYTFYTLDTHNPERGVLIDVKTAQVRDKAAHHPNLEMVEGDFADPGTIRRVGDVDCLFFFAVLLHQAAPDWDEVLEEWAKTNAKVFLIHNPQWTGERSVRLLDLGYDGYRREAPPAHDHLLKAALETPDAIWEGEGRSYRDLRHFWQFGVTDEDLITKMKSLGFDLKFLDDRGPFDSLPNFENRAFIFARP